MMLFGMVAILFGLAGHLPALWTVGTLLAMLGVLFWALGIAGQAVGGRPHYW